MVQVSIFDSVGASLRLVRAQIRPITLIAAIGALALTLVSVTGSSLGGVVALVFSIFTTAISAAVYAALIGLVLHDQPARRARLVRDARLVWTAMLVVMFFLFIVGVLFFMISLMIMAPALAPYASQMTAAGQDNAAIMAIAQRVLASNPGLVLFLMLLGAAIWMFVTSRLYLAASASVGAGRVLSFETWRWTNQNVLRIIGARALLLLPAYVLYDALSTLVARGVGINVAQGDPLAVLTATEALAANNLALYALFTFVTQFLVIFYTACEAALATYLYLALRPRTAMPPA